MNAAGKRLLVNQWLGPTTIFCTCVLVQLGGERFRLMWRFDGRQIFSGEVWRLLTGHFVHLGWAHFALNMAPLVMLCLLFAGLLSPVDWAVATLGSIVLIDAGLLLLQPEVGWYVGLSGVLHGLSAFGAIELLLARQAGGWVLAAGVTAKVAWEHFVGPMPFSTQVVAGHVVDAAHLYGAVGGALAVLPAGLLARRGNTELRAGV